MNIVIYSDYRQEHLAQSFIESMVLVGVKPNNVFYYTIDFDSALEYNFLTKIRWEKDSGLTNFNYYKPKICADALGRANGLFYYFDVDIIMGRRFIYFNPIIGNPYPICPVTPMPFPFRYFHSLDGNYYEWDETTFMKYLRVDKRSMNYVYTCFFTFDESCHLFLLESDAFCRFTYFVPHHELRVYPFADETIINVLLWRMEAKTNYGRIFCNTHKLTTIQMVEESDKITNINVDGNQYEQIEQSSRVMFYHGSKDKETNTHILNYYREKYGH